MKPVIYDQFDAAFRNVTAKAVLYQGEHVANVSLKHGRGATAYVHWIGAHMVRGTATGGGYDKATAAVYRALKVLQNQPRGQYEGSECRSVGKNYLPFVEALDGDTGRNWDRALRDAGFTIITVIG